MRVDELSCRWTVSIPTHQIYLHDFICSIAEISVHFLFKFELDVDSFDSRISADNIEVVSAIAVVWIHQQIYYFYVKIASGVKSGGHENWESKSNKIECYLGVFEPLSEIFV